MNKQMVLISLMINLKIFVIAYLQSPLGVSLCLACLSQSSPPLLSVPVFISQTLFSFILVYPTAIFTLIFACMQFIEEATLNLTQVASTDIDSDTILVFSAVNIIFYYYLSIFRMMIYLKAGILFVPFTVNINI